MRIIQREIRVRHRRPAVGARLDDGAADTHPDPGRCRNISHSHRQEHKCCAPAALDSTVQEAAGAARPKHYLQFARRRDATRDGVAPAGHNAHNASTTTGLQRWRHRRTH